VIRRLLLAWSALWPMLLGGCASLPPTNLPVCGQVMRMDDVCRAPVLAKKEHSRDRAWEALNACPTMQPLEGHPAFTTCYQYAGVRDSRQVYRQRVVRPRTP
jgi:hypothetical protein